MSVKKLEINSTLIWDYNFENYEGEEFKKWYIERVLSVGTKKDVNSIGIERIREYFPKLNLPDKVRNFWEWYLKNHENI